MRSIEMVWTLVRSIAGLVCFAGCNAVLGNQPGQASDADASLAGDVSGSQADLDANQPSDAPSAHDAHDAKPPLGDAGAGISCSPHQKICDMTCVSVTDPIFGCASASCDSCALARATSKCARGECAIDTCNAGYADCNQIANDGCETDLSLPAHCGLCNAICGAAAPNCAPAGNAFACVTGCPATAPTLCGNQCVDLLTTESHCGSCNNACSAVLNGRVQCSSGQCTFACASGFHACGVACASNASPSTCGSDCNPCPAAANATPSCVGGACGLVCNANFLDCNGSVSDGCEVSALSDPLNCGACGHSCNGQPCNGGICAQPVDAGSPDSGQPDAGAQDAGSSDTGASDSGGSGDGGAPADASRGG